MQGSLATRLRVLRAERGLTLREAADRVRVRPATLSDIEHGRSQPHDVTVAKIARAYGVPVEELLEEPVPLGEAPQESGLPEWAATPDLNTFSLKVSQLSRDKLDDFARALALVSSHRSVKREELPNLSREESTERAMDNARFFVVDNEYSRRGTSPPKRFTLAFAQLRNALPPEASEADTPPHEDAGTQGIAG